MDTKEEIRIGKDLDSRQTLIKDIGVDEFMDKLTTSESLRLATEIISYVYDFDNKELLAELQRIKEEFVLNNNIDLR